MISQAAAADRCGQRDVARSHCAIDSNGFVGSSNIAIIGTQASERARSPWKTSLPAVAAWFLRPVRGEQDDLICAQAADALTRAEQHLHAGLDHFRWPLARSTWALPSPYISKIPDQG